MERLDVLVRQVRDQTGNQQYTATQGIRQREFVRYANDAQMRIYNKILMERSTLYTRVGYMDVEVNEAVYTLATDIFLKHNIIKVDYSPNGDARGYFPLAMRSPRQEVSAPGYPDSYFLRHGELILSPIPTQSATRGLRLNYQYTLPTLDIRRAKITSVESTDEAANQWVEHSIGLSGSLCSTYGEGLFVVGASAGRISISADNGETWTPQTSQFGADTVNGLAHGEGRFVAVGGGGKISYSDDGQTWVAATSGVAGSLQSVAYGAGVFVAVGAAGILVMSYDGETWIVCTSGVNDNVNFVRYLNTLFIVAGSSGDLATSSDGVTWTARVSGLGAGAINDATYGAGVYVVAGDSGRLASSPTGVTWTSRTSSFGADNIYTVTFGGTRFVAGGSNGVMSQSTDGTTWTVTSSAITPLGFDVNELGYARGYYIAINDGGYIATSQTALTWEVYGDLGNVGYVPMTLSNEVAMVLDTTASSAYVHTYDANAYDITLDIGVGTLLSAETIAELSDEWVDYISVVDANGNILVSDVAVTEYYPETRIVACSSTDSALLDAADYYIVFGKFASTHSQLPDVAERYLTEYMAMRIQMRDSNTESINQSSVLRTLEEEIVDSIANLEEDLVSIAILDSSMMDYDSDL